MFVSFSLSISFSRIAVEKCKRRWRMIRTDYVRWLNQAEQRSNNKGPKKAAYYLSDDLKFLNPHLSLAESVEHEHEHDHDHDDRDSSELERDSKSRSKEPILEESSSSTYKAKPKETAEAVEERSQSGRELKPEEKKVKLKESDTKAVEAEEKEVASGPVDGAIKKKPEFFIKQSSLNSPNCLIIGKKHTQSETPPPSDLLEAMADDSADETASVGGGRRLRRSASRIKQLPIQKPAAAEQRQTRLQRRKSMSIAAAHSLRSSTSPVKMTPLPRTNLAAAAQPTAAAVPAQTTTVAASKSATASTPTSTHSSTPSPSALANNRDDIFPRPRAAAPLAQQLVLARRPGAVNPGQPSPTMPSPPVRHQIAPGRPPGPARVKATLQGNAAPVLAKRAPAPAPQIGVRHVAPSVGQVAMAMAPAQPRTISSSAPSSSNSSGIATGTSSSSSSVSVSSTGSVVNSTATPIASAFASASASASCSSSLARQLSERGSQTETADIFSDEHFLDMVRPQMREMNPRQKLHFKQKIFQALMETFDDATDFPGEGQAQHFNINTPSGFEHVSDPELRLMRELVSMVSAAKHTEKLQLGSSTQALSVAVAAQRAQQQQQQQQGNKIQTHVRIQRPPQGGTTNIVPASVTGSTVLGEDKKLYRILQMNSNAKIRAMAALQRKDSIDSNGSQGNVVPTRPGTFVVPASSPKTPTPLPTPPSQTLRIQDPLMSLFGAGAAQVPGNKLASSKDPLQVRQMGRRYSVCGAGGPITNLSAVSAASGSSSSSLASSGSPANAENAQLKRRMAPASQVVVPPQQRARYSHSPVANQLAGIAPGNSLLVRRAAAAAGAQKQPSPTGAGSVPQKTPQISNLQGSSGSGCAPSAFNTFATPATLRGSNSSLNNAGMAAGSNVSGGVSPLKRGMVIANVKGATQQHKQSPAAALVSAAAAAVSGLRSPVPQMKPSAGPTSSNVANLLGDARPVQGYMRAQPGHARPGGGRQSTGESETAGIIAADDFDMSRLKREPQDIMDDDILGM